MGVGGRKIPRTFQGKSKIIRGTSDKGYSIKKTDGGRKISVTPSDKIGIFQLPG